MHIPSMDGREAHHPYSTWKKARRGVGALNVGDKVVGVTGVGITFKPGIVGVDRRVSPPGNPAPNEPKHAKENRQKAQRERGKLSLIGNQRRVRVPMGKLLGTHYS